MWASRSQFTVSPFQLPPRLAAITSGKSAVTTGPISGPTVFEAGPSTVGDDAAVAILEHLHHPAEGARQR